MSKSSIQTLELVRDHFDAKGDPRVADIDVALRALERDIPPHFWWFAAGVACGSAGAWVVLLAG